MKPRWKAPERILVGTDLSRPASRAVVRAALIAAEHGARLRIVHATARPEHGSYRRLGLDSASALGRDPFAERGLERAASLAHAHGASPSTRLVGGRAATALRRQAERFAADLVVVASGSPFAVDFITAPE